MVLISSRTKAVDCVLLTMLVLATLAIIGRPGEFPDNDDFIYALSVKDLLETGRFTLPIPSSPNAIAQVYWGALFCLPHGFSFMALRLSTAVLAPVGVVAAYLLIAEIKSSRRLSLFSALCLACNPVYISQSATFMTDIPFTVAFTTALWLHVRCLVRDSLLAFVVGTSIAVIAVFIRQFALVEIVAFALAYSIHHNWHRQAVLAGAMSLAIATALHVAYSHWILATGRTPTLIVPLGQILPTDLAPFLKRLVHISVNSLPFLAACILPIFVLFAPLDRLTTHYSIRTNLLRVIVLTLATGIFGVLAGLGEMLPAPGNILAPWGIGPMVVRDTNLLGINQPHIPWQVTILWMALTVITVVVASMLTLRIIAVMATMIQNLIRGHGAKDAVKVLMLSTIGGYMMILFMLGHRSNFFDRYLLPLILPLLVLTIYAYGEPVLGSSKSKLGRGVLAGCMLLTGLAYAVLATHDHIAWQRARWQATNHLESAGITPEQIDGGWEYNGWLNYQMETSVHAGVSYWYVTDDLYIITNGPVPGYVEYGRVFVDRWLPLGPSVVYVLRRST